MQRRNSPLPLGTLLLLAACSSAPTHFYTLLRPADSPMEQPTPAPFAIEVMPVGVPAEADQPQLIVRTGTGRVAVLDNERWAAPLGDEIRAALADELGRTLSAHDVYKEPHRKELPVYRIQLDVRRFESAPAGYALIDADWNVRSGNDAVIAACHSRISQTVGSGYDALIEGHQRALGEIAARIASVVRGAAAGEAPRCPQ